MVFGAGLLLIVIGIVGGGGGRVGIEDGDSNGTTNVYDQ
jgi:hypothetical protein